MLTTARVEIMQSELPSARRFSAAKPVLAREIGRATRYCDTVYHYHPLPHDTGLLLKLLSAPKKTVIPVGESLPSFAQDRTSYPVVLMDGTLNHHINIQGLLTDLRAKLNRTSRVVIVLYNPYLRFLFKWANKLGLRSGEPPSTFITETDLQDLARLSGLEVVRERPSVYVPFKLLGIGTLLNTLLPLVPGIRWLGLTHVVTLRPVIAETSAPSLTVIIPARNERGNIENAVKRMPKLGCSGQDAKLEIIYVEGHSNDQTWEEILRVQKEWGDRFSIKAFKQSGKGKADAVRLGLSHATCDLVTVLDADLTMPPEDLGKFYDAYCQGHADFINGSRLVYPMEGEAMRPLNWLGNIFFAKALSWVLDARLGDSLCGTKLMSRRDYQRFVAWRKDFGDFDPFGDYEMLFPACILGLGVIDVPIYYRARTYGQTNIQRFRHGLMLLKMTLIGLLRVKTGSSAT